MTKTIPFPIALPPISGREAHIRSVVQHREPVYLPRTKLDPTNIKSTFACALHMHQPTIPAGQYGDLICNLQHMFEHPHDGDNHNANVFAWCYQRMGKFIPELVDRGLSPRVMLDYSGNLLWGLQQMNRKDILDSLINITCNDRYSPYVEWLGTMWSHSVAPSTPIPDLILQIRAWQHHFCDIFGEAALSRVKGFSPPEMHLPNHPDTLFEYIKALKDCGYLWLLVQEHSIENLDGSSLSTDQKYVPNRLVARNSQGETISILALIKTQGSDTKLVAQMQPYYEAKTRDKQTIGGITIPSCVSQIADGENGGVMMNEFPGGYMPVWEQIQRDGSVVGINGTEYIELVFSLGVQESNLPTCQGIEQHKIWQRVDPAHPSPAAIEEAITHLKTTDDRFQMDGASWTNNLSWVKGYENVLEPMNQLSAKFHTKFDPILERTPSARARPDYQQALMFNLLLQTSCFRYWGQGTWTDYAKELFRRGEEVLD